MFGRGTARGTLLGSLGEIYLERDLFAVPEDRQVYRVARQVASQRGDQVSRATDLLPASGGHDVTAPYSGVVCGTAGLDLLDQHARVYGAPEPSRGLPGQIGEVDAEVGVRGLAALDDLVRYGGRRGRRYGETDVLGARLARRQVGDVDTDDPPVAVREGAA